MLKNKILAMLIFLFMPVITNALDKWQKNNDKEIVIYQISEFSIKDENANDVFPKIEFYCSKNNTSILARINWKRFISSFNTEIGFKIDQQNFFWSKWKVDNTTKVTYSPSEENTKHLIAQMIKGKKLREKAKP